MNLQMIGVDFQDADIEQREPLAFTKSGVLSLLPQIALEDGVQACALLCTCNRTELYLHTSRSVDALKLLTTLVGVSTEQYRALSTMRAGEATVQHIMEVSSGLKSQIVGDDQIVTQVRVALDLAREAGTSDGVIDTLLRRAVTAGKRVKTETKLSGVSNSAAARAVQKAQQHFTDLVNKRAVVIGNGEMGRLSASLLRDAGCDVTITLRSYHHGETVVPAGCKTHPYEDRYALINGADLVLSATTSPHLTLTASNLTMLSMPPSLLIDLAMPRDIDINAMQDQRMTVWNLDDLGKLADENAEERLRAMQIIDEAFCDFKTWYHYREALPFIAEIKRLAAERVHFDREYAHLAGEGDLDDLVRLTTEKTVDMLLGGMKDIVSAQRLSSCLRHMRKGCGK